MFASWQALYETRAVGVYALLVLPALFLGVLAVRGVARHGGVEPWAARFVRGWAIVFALTALFDPIATGILGWPLVPFVLLGDFRVFVLVLVVMQPGRRRAGLVAEALGWTMVVPVVAYGLYRGLGAAHGQPPEMVLWVLYESAFTLLAAGIAVGLVPARVGAVRRPVRRYVHAVLGIVVLYYALWAAADGLILAGHDRGWAVRIVANELYYGAFVPLAYLLFFASRSAATSSSTQAAR